MNVNIDTSKIRIETDRLILRGFSDDDLSDLYEYAGVPGVGEMAGWPHHESIETSKRILHSFMAENEVFALVLKETGKVIGSLGLHYSWANDDPKYTDMKSKEIGFVLSRDYWGQEAVTAVILMCFHEYGCDILTCGYFSTNNQSRRVIEKAGFKFEKQSIWHSKQLSKDFDVIEYVLLRTEWSGATCFVRPAKISDATNVATILCESWRSAYSDILLPDELERKTNVRERTEKERYFISSGSNIYISFSNGVPCGIMSFCQSRDKDLENYAEIVSMHTLKSVWGKGVGNVLMEFALTKIKQHGFTHVLLWVFEANARARRFYEKNGFVLDGAIKDSGFGNAKEIRYTLVF